MIKSFRKKPVIVRAVEWDGVHKKEVIDFCKGYAIIGITGTLRIMTEEGVMDASVGDWIIEGVNGEFYPCKPDVFKKTYEEVIDLRSATGIEEMEKSFLRGHE